MKKPAGTSTSTYLTSKISDRGRTSGGRGGRGGPAGGRGGGGRGARGATVKKGSPPPKKYMKKTVKFKEEKAIKPLARST